LYFKNQELPIESKFPRLDFQATLGESKRCVACNKMQKTKGEQKKNEARKERKGRHSEKVGDGMSTCLYLCKIRNEVKRNCHWKK